MAKKKIRVAFYFADEIIFKLAKEWRTKERLIKWANEFFGRYGFEIDQPSSGNEKKYRADFSLAESDGPKAAYTFDIIMEKFNKNTDEFIKGVMAESEEYDKNPPSDLHERAAKANELTDKLKSALNQKDIYMNYLKSFRVNILEFRKLILEKMKKSKSKDDRVVVVLCEFENYLDKISPLATRGETFTNVDQEISLLIMNLLPFDPDYYTGPLILIDILSMTKHLEGTLAHEIVHAAGPTTTKDNEGDPNNIMVYNAVLKKAPADIILLETDKKALEQAYFVR